MVLVDPAGRTASLPARINQTRGVIEYALVTDYGKTHESLLVTDAAPMDLQTALLLLGASPSGTNAVASSNTPPVASSLDLAVRWTGPEGETIRPLHALIARSADPNALAPTGHLAAGPWLFNGSQITAEGFAAHFEGSIISVIRDPAAIVSNPRPDRDDDDIHVPAADRLPTNGTPVEVIFRPESPKPAR